MSQGEPAGLPELTEHDYRALAATVYAETGIHLTPAKKPLLAARLQRRLRHHQLRSFAAYVDILGQRDDEVQELVNCITTNKTDFFRENVQFDRLAAEVVPALVARGDFRVRLWSAAASTGEEAYTLAMVLDEHLPEPRRWDVKILATDIDTQVLAKAARGVYADERVTPVGERRLARHFEPAPGGGWAVKPHLRAWVQFREMNLVADGWPLTAQFDAVFLRNVIIYFDQPTKDRLVRRMASHVRADGRFFVGLSEAIHWMPDVWRAVGPSMYAHARPGQAPRPAPSAPAAPPRARPAPGAPRPASPTGRGSTRLELDHGLPGTRIIVGEIAARAEPAVVSTLLGSCVAVGLFDPVAGVGGLNHFLLPSVEATTPERAASYGVHAMELLINAVMRAGGQRSRLKAKVFGGGRILAGLAQHSDIGAGNLSFAREFLEREGIPVLATVPGGTGGLDVRFATHTGQAWVRKVEVNALAEVEATARVHASTLEREREPTAELF